MLAHSSPASSSLPFLLTHLGDDAQLLVFDNRTEVNNPICSKTLWISSSMDNTVRAHKGKNVRERRWKDRPSNNTPEYNIVDPTIDGIDSFISLECFFSWLINYLLFTTKALHYHYYTTHTDHNKDGVTWSFWCLAASSSGVMKASMKDW